MVDLCCQTLDPEAGLCILIAVILPKAAFVTWLSLLQGMTSIFFQTERARIFLLAFVLEIFPRMKLIF